MDLETPQHISELNSAIAFSRLKNAIALFSSEMCCGVSKSTSHPRTMMYMAVFSCFCLSFSLTSFFLSFGHIFFTVLWCPFVATLMFWILIFYVCLHDFYHADGTL